MQSKNQSHNSTSKRMEMNLRLQHSLWFPENGCLCDHGSNNIWVHVRRRPPVLKVPFPRMLSVPAHSDRCATVRDSLTKPSQVHEKKYPKESCHSVLVKLTGNSLFTHKKVLISAVSWRPVRRRSLPSPYAAMCSLCLSPSFSIAFLMTSYPPSLLIDLVLKQ